MSILREIAAFLEPRMATTQHVGVQTDPLPPLCFNDFRAGWCEYLDPFRAGLQQWLSTGQSYGEPERDEHRYRRIGRRGHVCSQLVFHGADTRCIAARPCCVSDRNRQVGAALEHIPVPDSNDGATATVISTRDGARE